MRRLASAGQDDWFLEDGPPGRIAAQEADEPLDWVLAEFRESTGAGAAILVEEDGDRLSSVAIEQGASGERMLRAFASARRVNRVAADGACWIDLNSDGPGTMLRVPILGGAGRCLCALLAFPRRPDAGAYGLAAKLRPFVSALQPYMKLWQRFHAERKRTNGLKAALDQQEGGVFLLGSDGRLLFTNTDGERLLAAHDGLRERHGALSATELGDALRLQVAIDHVLNANRSGKGDASRASLPIMMIRRSHDRPPLVIAVVALDARAERGGDPAAVMFALRPEKDTAQRITPICRLHGLSPVETRLVCHLVAGMTMCEAALVMRIKQLTARTYLKQIFLKTGARRQAELIRMMMASLLPLTDIKSFQTV